MRVTRTCNAAALAELLFGLFPFLRRSSRTRDGNGALSNSAELEWLLPVGAGRTRCTRTDELVDRWSTVFLLDDADTMFGC